MTNYEKYFGTPKRAARTLVQQYGGFGTQARVSVEHRTREVADVPKRAYRKWLESEADHE